MAASILIIHSQQVAEAQTSPKQNQSKTNTSNQAKYGNTSTSSTSPKENAPQEEPAILRISCTGDSVGTKIYINDKIKGECPIDVSLKPGQATVRGIKAVNEYTERLFSQELILGEGVVKKMEVSLGEPQETESNKLLREKEDQLYKDLPIPKRPNLPDYPLDAEKLRILENFEKTDAFRRYAATVVKKAFKIEWHSNAKEKNNGGQPVETTGETMSTPYENYIFLSDGTNAYDISYKINPSNKSWEIDKRIRRDKEIEILGSLLDGMVKDADSFTATLTKISGSLYPFRIGAKMKSTWSIYEKKDKTTRVEEQEIIISKKIPAFKLIENFNGFAWEVIIANHIAGYYFDENGYFYGIGNVCFNNVDDSFLQERYTEIKMKNVCAPAG